MMLIDFDPGDYVINPSNKNWGKRVINVENINLEKVSNEF